MNNKSFTLIELLVVIVIIGILAGVIMISTSSSIDKANITKLKIFEESVSNNLTANMVSRWKIDEGFNDIINDSWGNNIGTLVNFVNTDMGGGDGVGTSGWVSESNCVSGTCLKFDGLNDYIQLSNLQNLQNFTISIWIKGLGDSLSGQTGYNTFVGRTSSNRLLYKTDGLLLAQMGAGNHSSILKAPRNQWNQIVYTYNNAITTAKWYINGNSDSEKVGVISIDQSSRIGAFDGVNYMMNGLIDDVRIYNNTLSLSQIKENYIAGLDSLLLQGGISKENYNQRIERLGVVEKKL